MGTWRAARAEQDDITEDEVREALLKFDPLWDKLFPAEQARIVQLLVERVDVRTHGVAVGLRSNGLSGSVRDAAGTQEGGGMKRRATRLSADGETITIYIPMTFRKRGGRKMVVTPDGAPWAPRPRVDNAMVKALARAFRWQRMLDDGICATIEDLAKREKVNRGYLSRALRLTLLAPESWKRSSMGGSRRDCGWRTCCRGPLRRGGSSALDWCGPGSPPDAPRRSAGCK